MKQQQLLTQVVSISCICLVVLATTLYAQNSDKINHLPGYTGDIPFNQYAGYLLANATNGRHLFYWFVESQANPEKDPVVLWMNGGPGCSSLDGLLTEHSPFRIEPNGKELKSNPYSWNKVANVIYLESPAGVGFSYSENPSVDYNQLNDDKTAADVYNFLVEFFKKYPQFRANPFFVSGESYAGHYVPTTSFAVHTGNLAGKNPKINLQGFLVGNGVTDGETDTNSIPPFMYNHALLSAADYQAGINACRGNFYKNQNDPVCANALSNFFNIITGVNPYYLYGECLGDKGPFATRKSSISRTHPLFNLWRLAGQPGSNGGAPCLDASPETKYLNTPEVKAAIHARQDIEWQFCNDQINNAYNRTYDSMIPFYEKLLQAGIRAVVYSGDVDLAVNVMGSMQAVEKLAQKMGASVTDKWRTWAYEDGPVFGKQVGGMTQSYSNNLRFVTIRGAGHMVPTQKPFPALIFFSKFLNNEPMPPSM